MVLKGDTNIKYLKENGVRSGMNGKMKWRFGNVYGYQWRSCWLPMDSILTNITSG